ncbi:GGDEF domain-containing protein [Pseudomonas stutzeri]|nr:GGDEF domain-containing protein [Stutzerimonas stutzeri]
MRAPSPSAQFQPRLATTVRLGLCGLLLLFGLGVWLGLPLLGGIASKANQVRDEYLPDLTRWRYNTQRIEQLFGFVQTLYWSSDAHVARSSRLQTQVLLDSFAFSPGSELATQSAHVLRDIQHLAELRDAQRATLREARQLAEALLGADPVSADRVGRFAASCTRLSLIGTDWQALWHEAGQLQALVHGPAQQGLTHLQSHFAQLQELETQVERTYRQVLAQQKRLAAALNTDTALKTQQIAQAVEHEATQLRRYGLLAMLLLGGITLGMLYAFQRFLLQPILLCNRALEQLNGERPVQPPPHTLFHELDTIGRSVREYSDMTRQLQLANRELIQLSQRDGLTGLSNRRHFDTHLAAEHARACRHGHDLTLLLIDIDHFKALNDRHGHLFGDDCLRQLADVLRRLSQRPGDLAARYGGEEFALILPEMDLAGSHQLAERVRRAIAELITLTDTGEPVHFTASLGLLHVGKARQHTPESMIHQADLALYRAKQQGRNRVEIAAEAVAQP